MSERMFRSLAVLAAVVAVLVPVPFLFPGSEHLFGVVGIVPSAFPSKPADSFSVVFSDVIPDGTTVPEISVFPEIPHRTERHAGGTGISVFPTDRWEPGKEYRVAIGGGRIGFLKSLSSASFSFDVPDYPKVVSISPPDGSTDILLDIEDPVIVRFDRSVDDFFIDFRLSPEIGAVYEHDDGKTEFRILPDSQAKPGTRYDLGIFAKWRGESDDAYREIGRASFRTIADAPEEWSSDPTERAAQAKRYAHAAIMTGKYIDIDRANQVMTLFQDGRAIDAYPISSGKPGMETPAGRYEIRNKADRPWSPSYGLYMPYWMALVPDGKFGIHELPEWPGGYKEGANHLGIPVSHGCVRLGVGPAERVYRWTEVGTPVIIR